MKKALLKLILPPLLLLSASVSAQQIGIKTNALYWATTTPNLGMEIATGLKTTINLSGAYNPWTFGYNQSNKKIQHWAVTGQVRFWPYEKFDGHFLAPQVGFISYNSGGVNIPLFPFDNLKDYRYEGYAVGAGFTYGYQWYLSPHWNLEASVGIGYYYLNYKKSECRRCRSFIEKNTKHWFGPSNVGVSFIYLIKSHR